MTLLIVVVSFAWALYCSTRKFKPEYITIVALSFYFIYYILGGWLFPDIYFPFLNQKNKAFAVFFPVVVSAMLLASLLGNLLILTTPREAFSKTVDDPHLGGFYVLAVIYSVFIVVFVFQSDFGIVGKSGGVLENVNTRTSLVYENKLYSYVSYAVFFTLPLISLFFFEYNRKILAVILLFLCALAVSITGQKSSLVLVLLTIFFYFLVKFGFFRAMRMAAIPSVIVVASLVAIVLIWNQDTLTGSFYTNIYLSIRGIVERVTLTGTRLTSEYIYLADMFPYKLENLPSDQSISVFVYNMIESDGLVGSKPGHISLIKYLTDGIIEVFLSTLLLYLTYFLVKFVATVELVDSRAQKIIDSWILVSIVNATITDSFMHLSAWLFSVLFIFGALIVFGCIPRLLNGSVFVKVPFKSVILNSMSVVAFFYYLQGLIRGLL